MGLLAAAPVQAQNGPDRIKVLIGFDRTPGAADETLVRGVGGAVKYRYHLVPAIAASIPENAVAALLRSPRVTSVELDGEVHAIDAELDNTWGVKHIGAGIVHGDGNTGAGVSVAVIDSGIDCDHPDLSANCAGGYSDPVRAKTRCPEDAMWASVPSSRTWWVNVSNERTATRLSEMGPCREMVKRTAVPSGKNSGQL